MNMSNFTLLALSKTKKQHLSSITLTKNRHVYQVYVHIFIFVCLIVDFFFLSAHRGGENFRRASADSPEVKKHKAPGTVPPVFTA